MTIPRPEYPRPQAERAEWLNLNGRWEFELDENRSGLERQLAEGRQALGGEIIVPFCPESALSGIGKTEFLPPLWYRRAFNVPASWQGKRVLLHFGAVDYECTAWVNGKEVGGHRGGYGAFCFDITAALDWAGANTLVVHALDDTLSPLQAKGKQSMKPESYGCMYTRVSGIWQTVWLEAVPQSYIAEFALTPDWANGALAVTAQIVGGRDAELQVTALAEGKACGEARVRAQGRVAMAYLPLSVRHSWSPQDPFLYDVELTLRHADGSVDRVQSYFGLRVIAVEGRAVLLNGQPIFLRQVLDQGYYPDGIYTAPSDEALRRDIELGLAFGFNGARMHQKVFEQRYLYWADKLGYLIWAEYGDWGMDINDPRMLERMIEEWVPILRAQYSHPAVMGWCPCNERNASGNPGLLRTLFQLTKALDPTRPVIDTSGYIHVLSEFYDVHDYDQNVESFTARYQPLAEGRDVDIYKAKGRDWDIPHDGQPFYVSEYGGIWWNPGQKDDKSWGYGGVDGRPRSEAEFLARYKGLTEALLRNPGICGFCYTQITDVEQEVNGLVSYNRELKFDPALIRAINTQKAAIEK
jgi:beta-galactosidase/beta-glucuronidase